MKNVTILTLLVMLFSVASVFSQNRGKPKETPIKGTDLVTYTYKGSKKMGVKKPGERGETILYDEYVSVEAYNNWLWVKTEENADIKIFRKDGKEVFSGVKILENGSNYRIISDSSAPKGKRYISQKAGPAGNNTTPYEEMFVAEVYESNYVFTRNMGRWGLTSNDRYSSILSNQYDKIGILYVEQGKKVFFFGRTEENRFNIDTGQSWKVKVWHCAEKNGETYTPYKSRSEEYLNELIKGSTLKMDKLDGTLTVYEK